jgi:hypothetical protein
VLISSSPCGPHMQAVLSELGLPAVEAPHTSQGIV